VLVRGTYYVAKLLRRAQSIDPEAAAVKPISHHRLRPDETVLSSRVGVGGVNTIRDYSKLSRLKISKLNMFDIYRQHCAQRKPAGV